MRRLLETVAPARLGSSFRWLLASSWVSNLGDGFALAAGPLLVASQTRSPTLVALATLLVQLPWLAFGLIAGGLADRLNRRTMVVAVDLLRAGMLVVLAAAVLDHQVNIGIVLIVVFLMGTAEVFANTASGTLAPMLVHRDDLAIANARLQTGFITVNQLAGPPIGATLFAVGMAVPFLGQAVLVAAGAVLMTRMSLPDEPPRPLNRRELRMDIVAGFRWVIRHAAVRTLVLTILIFNVTFGAAWSVLVLYARDHLGMGAIGFGLLTTASAIGGIGGSLMYGAITRRVSLGNLMRVGLILETFTHLALALNTSAAIAVVIFVVFGAHALIWGTTSITIRQRAVPTTLQGRVNSVNNVASYGGIVVGAAIGGPIASTWGLTAPFWFAFVGSGLFVVVIWQQLRHVAHTDAAPAPA